mmetsp:Transcript_66553/g.98636  ORF Transcript_66553/g.98636 Transcript_66553/m.98636 type:complete len:87 (-) Transcript_66553:334-594(-)
MITHKYSKICSLAVLIISVTWAEVKIVQQYENTIKEQFHALNILYFAHASRPFRSSKDIPICKPTLPQLGGSMEIHSTIKSLLPIG